jgi:signal transduction histidine kinase
LKPSDTNSEVAGAPPRRRDSSETWLRPSQAAFWDPRRSLGARLLWILVPSFLIAATLFHIASARLYSKTEDEMTELLVAQASRVEAASLRQSAERRARQLEDRSAEVLDVLAQAGGLASKALSERGGPVAPAEELADDGHGPFHTAGRAASTAIVSRALGLTEAARRDLAATRRLEPGFSALAAGHTELSAVFVATLAGVLRAVPSHVLTPPAQAAFAGFKIPDRWPKSLAPGGSPGLYWTAPYEDVYAERGRIVTAMQAVYDASGALAGEVGVDWAFGELFARVPDLSRPGEAELVFAGDGGLLLRLPAEKDGWLTAGGDPASPLTDLFAKVSSRDEVSERAVVDGRSVLLESRKVPHVGWTYVRLLPLAALRHGVVKELEPVFAASRAERNRVQNAYVIAVVAIGFALVWVARNAIAPVRHLARYADAIAEGAALPETDAADRRDEVGRLARAMERLASRIARRIATMTGMHEVARTASLMARAGETYAGLSSRIAELLDAKKSWIALWDAEARMLVFTPPGYGVPDDRLSGVKIGLEDRALAMLAFRTGETCVTNDLAHDPRISRRIAEVVDVKESALFVPLKTEAGPLGVLIVCDKPGGFDAEDEAAVQGYADQAALLLRNARLYEELQKSYDRLREAQRNRDYFLQNVNHELRTPLTAILGWSEILADDAPPPRAVKTAVEQIRRSAQFLVTLISDLLDLSRVEAGMTKIEPVPTDLGGLVVDSIEPVAVMAEGKGIAINVEAPTRGEQAASLDPVRIRQVLWNLVHNAVKFTPKGGRIDVSARRGDGRDVVFRVADTGVGVDPKDLPYIFDRFRQGDGSTTRAYRGTGIGLALAKAYVELHGGTIGVESGPGQGAVFTIRIPDAARGASLDAIPRLRPAADPDRPPGASA